LFIIQVYLDNRKFKIMMAQEKKQKTRGKVLEK
jgi:hypothetical protein